MDKVIVFSLFIYFWSVIWVSTINTPLHLCYSPFDFGLGFRWTLLQRFSEMRAYVDVNMLQWTCASQQRRRDQGRKWLSKKLSTCQGCCHVTNFQWKSQCPFVLNAARLRISLPCDSWLLLHSRRSHPFTNFQCEENGSALNKQCSVLSGRHFQFVRFLAASDHRSFDLVKILASLDISVKTQWTW